jgi:hypothetical protein
MSKKNEEKIGFINVHLLIESADLHPDFISEVLRSVPSSVDVKGDLYGNGVSRYSKNYWRIDFGESLDGNWNDFKKQIMDFVGQKKSQLVDFADRSEAVIYLCVDNKYTSYHLGWSLSPHELAILAESRINLVVATYQV